MKLIEFDGQEFKIADEALLIRPIRELLEKDKSKRKEEFWKQISFLWFMCDPRSTYQYLTDEKERALEIKTQEGLGAEWEPSKTLQDAMNIYRKHTITTASLLLDSMRKGSEKIQKFLEDLDLFALDKNGKPIYQVSTITTTLKQIPELAKSMSEAEKALAKDFDNEDKARGNSSKAVGEDI
jgi:hypothetical protein